MLRFLACSQQAPTAHAAKLLTKVATVLYDSFMRMWERDLPGGGGAWLCTGTAPVVRMVHRFSASNPSNQ